MKKTFGFGVFIILISIFLGGTKAQDIAKDQDGNIFQTIKIRSQVWMAENLNVDHYRNGDTIPQVQDKDEWINLETGAWCYYDNESANGEKYGKLYNWYAVTDPRGLAPEGWHIPTFAEFETLENTVGDDGNALKAIGQGTGVGAGTNTSGFSALLAGIHNYYGNFFGLWNYTIFWSSTEYDSDNAFSLGLSNNDSIIKSGNGLKRLGFSVRCLFKERGNSYKITYDEEKVEDEEKAENVKIITPERSETVKDIDGNVYNTVAIGKQMWMKENLKTTKYNDGTPIPNVTDDAQWENLTTGAYCWYNNDSTTHKNPYGALYNWYAVGTGNLCPKGWRIPTENEWYLLGLHLLSNAGSLKETGTVHWKKPNTGATNVTGFTALPSGIRRENGSFTNIGGYGYWWASTDYNETGAHDRSIKYNSGSLWVGGSSKTRGSSCRCIKD